MFNRAVAPLVAALMTATAVCAVPTVVDDRRAPAVARSTPPVPDHPGPVRSGDWVMAAAAAPPSPAASPRPTSLESIHTVVNARRTPRAPVPAVPAPPAADPLDMVTAALPPAVPAVWLASVPVSIHLIPGSTSWSDVGVPIAIGIGQTDTWKHAQYVVTHEWAHHVAFRFGSGAYTGAPPPGFPAHLANAAEYWAQCVAQSVLGYTWPSAYPDCSSDALAWVRDWLAAGPPA